MSRATIFTVEEDDDQYFIMLPKKRRLPLVGGAAVMPDHLLPTRDRNKALVERFVSEALIRDPDGILVATRIHDEFEAWRQLRGERSLTGKAISTALVDLGFAKRKAGEMIYEGLALSDWNQPRQDRPLATAEVADVPQGDTVDQGDQGADK
jgi:hypothetical protein